MRINKYVALATGMSRRKADEVIISGRIKLNGALPTTGHEIASSDIVTLDDNPLTIPEQFTSILLNKPVGFVVSRDGQGSKTIYDLLPEEYQNLKPVGRLDKESSGLLLLTNDGELANALSHPSSQKEKVYEVELNRPLSMEDYKKITKIGVDIGSGKPSRFRLAVSSKLQVASKRLAPKQPYYFLPSTYYWRAALAEGRNRQIRRTFAALNYAVVTLHRISFGPYELANIGVGEFIIL